MGVDTGLAEAIADLDEDTALDLVRNALDAGIPAVQILQSCQNGMAVVGQRFEQEEYFVSDLMMAGEIFTAINEILAPALEATGETSIGTVVMGTVRGDVHNIGKDVVVNMLKAANFRVVDLGVDVAPEAFVAALRESSAHILGMSGLLTLAFDSMKATVDQVTAAGMRETVKIMIGGGPVDANVCRIVGADAWSTDAQRAVRFAQSWVG